MLNQFSRTELLLGKEKMEYLKNARVAVFGIGGVGGYTVEALARSGVGTLDLIDDDKIERNRRKICYLNVRWFMMTLLNRMDRCSMFSGLEARVPYADYRILEYVFNVPWKYKCYNNQAKSLLVEGGKNYLPKEVLYRKKSPYPKTYDPDYEKLLGNLALEEFHANPKLSEIIDKEKLVNFIKSPKDYGKPWYGQLMAGPQMLAYIIQISYWLKEYIK